MIRSRRIGWAGHVARMGRRETPTGYWWGELREGNHFEDIGLDGRIILKLVFKEQNKRK